MIIAIIYRLFEAVKILPVYFYIEYPGRQFSFAPDLWSDVGNPELFVKRNTLIKKSFQLSRIVE